jgi:hypothetical protein
MKARFQINDEFKLKEDGNFTRTFPRSRNSDGSVGEIDVAKVRAGGVAKIYEVHESTVERIEPRYDLEFTGRDEELKVHFKETDVLKLFEPLA